MSGIMGMLLGGGGVATGQEIYTSPGTYSWTCPVGVTSVSVVAVGGGGGGVGSNGGVGSAYGSGAGGGQIGRAHV